MDAILRPYLDLISNFLSDGLPADTFTTAFMALYSQDDERETLPRQIKRQLDTAFAGCESYKEAPNKRDRYQYGETELREELTDISDQVKRISVARKK